MEGRYISHSYSTPGRDRWHPFLLNQTWRAWEMILRSCTNFKILNHKYSGNCTKLGCEPFFSEYFLRMWGKPVCVPSGLKCSYSFCFDFGDILEQLPRKGVSLRCSPLHTPTLHLPDICADSYFSTSCV